MRIALTIVLEDEPTRSVVVLWETTAPSIIEGLVRLKGEMDGVILARRPEQAEVSWTIVKDPDPRQPGATDDHDLDRPAMAPEPAASGGQLDLF